MPRALTTDSRSHFLGMELNQSTHRSVDMNQKRIGYFDKQRAERAREAGSSSACCRRAFRLCRRTRCSLAKRNKVSDLRSKSIMRVSVATILLLKLNSVRTLDSAADNALAAASPDHTSQCLASVNTLGLEHENKFQWRGLDGIKQTGTCHDVRTSFDLCSKSPPRECLLARVPWQTALGTARCCFHCCMHYWQDHLGLSDIYRHWFQNPELKDWNYHAGYGKAGGNMIPDLNSVVMQVNSVKRFSLFLWNVKSSGGVDLLNATHLVQENGGGGVVWSHGDAIRPFEDHVNDYVTSHPVSVVYQSDSWKPHYPFARLKADGRKDSFPTGGHYYTINSIADTGPVVGIPLGVMTAHFEGHLGNHAQNRDRKSLLMCCCMVSVLPYRCILCLVDRVAFNESMRN